MIQPITIYSKFVSKHCFSRHTATSPRARHSRPYRLAFLLLVCGLVLIFAPWASTRLNRHVQIHERLGLLRPGKVFEFHRRQLLSPQSPLTSLQSASESVTRLPSTFARSVFRTFLSSAQPRPSSNSTAGNDDDASGAINASASAEYTNLSPLHMRRHVGRDYFEPNVALQDATRGSNGRRSQTAGGHQKSNGGNGLPTDSDGSSSKSADNQHEVCVAIASMPRVFPERRKLPPWHFPVSLLEMLERRRSPSNMTGGFKDMNVVVYSSGCDEKREFLQRLKKQAAARAASDASALEEDLRPTTTTRSLPDGATRRDVESPKEPVLTPQGDLEERKETMAGVLHEKALRLAGNESSLNVTVLPSRQDACDFVQEDEEELRKLGVTNEMASDGWKSWRWRTKLVMDFVYVMRQCMATKPKYILLLQDDTRPARLYDIGIEKFINEEIKEKEWTVLSLYYPESYLWPYDHGGEYLIPCCAQALLFNVSALDDLLGFVEERFTEAPMDWLVNKYLTSANRTGYVHVPSLFQHVGDVRTKAPGVSSRPHRDRRFHDDYVVNLLKAAGSTDILENADYVADGGNNLGESFAEAELRQLFKAYPKAALGNPLLAPETAWSGAAAGAEPGGADSGGAVRGGAEPGGAATGGAEPGGSGPGSATAEGAEPGGAELGGTVPGAAELGGAGSGGARSGVAEPGGATSGAVEPGVSPAAASRREPLSPSELREWFARRWRRASGAGAPEGVGAETTAVCPGGGSTTGAAGGPAAGGVGGAGVVAEGAGAVPAESGVAARPRPYFVPLLQQVLGLSPPVECPQPVQSQSLLEPSSPLPAPSPYTGPTGGLAERREPTSRPVSPVRAARTSGRGSRLRPPPVPGTHRMSLRPSTAPLRAPLPSPPESSLPVLADPASDSLRAASPTVTRLLATVVTDPSFESTTASALVAELVDFAARCRLDYTASLVSASASDCPLSVGGDCALGTDVLEDRQEELQCLAAASPHLASVLLAPEGDPDALDIPTPHSYAEAVEGPYSSQWQAAMDAEMASWKSTGTYVDAVPPPGANIVSGMWIFRVKRPPGSPPVFKARYVARGFSQRQATDHVGPEGVLVRHVCALLHFVGAL
ncbi:unnamed protein product [Closterium sp. NIES-54]